MMREICNIKYLIFYIQLIFYIKLIIKLIWHIKVLKHKWSYQRCANYGEIMQSFQDNHLNL